MQAMVELETYYTLNLKRKEICVLMITTYRQRNSKHINLSSVSSATLRKLVSHNVKIEERVLVEEQSTISSFQIKCMKQDKRAGISITQFRDKSLKLRTLLLNLSPALTSFKIKLTSQTDRAVKVVTAPAV